MRFFSRMTMPTISTGLMISAACTCETAGNPSAYTQTLPRRQRSAAALPTRSGNSRAAPTNHFLPFAASRRPFRVKGAGGVVAASSYRVPHGAIQALGFRFGPVGYTPDLSDMSEEAWRELHGIDLWIVDALQATPHPTHAHLPLTLSWISALRPKRAVLTNMHYWLDYEETARIVPSGVQPAHDMLSFEFPV